MELGKRIILILGVALCVLVASIAVARDEESEPTATDQVERRLGPCTDRCQVVVATDVFVGRVISRVP